MKNSRGKGDRSNKASFFIRLLRIAVVSLAQGFRKLSTPVGFLAAIPLAVSAAAYIRSSVEITRVILFINQPVSFEVEFKESEPGRWDVVYAQAPRFEFFLSSSGSQTVYIRTLRINVTLENKGAYFDESCNYLYPKKEDGTQSYDAPFSLETEVLSINYPYRLEAGFVISPNDVIPLSGKIRSENNERLDRQISQALGATRDETTDSRMLKLVTEAVAGASSKVNVCLTGLAFVSGRDSRRIQWSANSGVGDVSMSTFEERISRPPVVPGEEEAFPLLRQRLEIHGGDLGSGVLLFTNRKLELF